MKYYYLVKHYVKLFLLYILNNILKNNFIYFSIMIKKRERLIKNLKNKANKNRKINVVFLINRAHYNQCFSTINAMKDDDRFSVKIVIPPWTTPPREIAEIAKTTYEFLKKEFPWCTIEIGWDFSKNKCIDLITTQTDLVFFSFPYDTDGDPIYYISNIYKKNILTVYLPYSTYLLPSVESSIKRYVNYDIFKKITYNFTENEDTLFLFNKLQKRNLKNNFIVGCPKLEQIKEIVKKSSLRKKIFICPHHSLGLDGEGFQTSNFLVYADFFLNLPQKYPQIDFIFRPHPYLYEKLSSQSWGVEKTNTYFEKMKSLPNVTYQESGDYWDDFVNSDGMILDCCSFMAEYMITEHPMLYMLRNKNNLYQDMGYIGEKFLKQMYHAFNEKDIINFIEDVILKNNDTMKSQRQDFIKNYMKYTPNENIAKKIIEKTILN